MTPILVPIKDKFATYALKASLTAPWPRGKKGKMLDDKTRDIS